MRIVLASAHLEPGPDAVPLGAACVAAALKAAFPSLIVSLAESFVADGEKALASKIKAEAPQSDAISCVGFSLYSWNRAVMIGAARILRAETPDIFLFCGGPEVGARPQGLAVSEGGSFDAAIRGEGEAAATALIGRRFFDAPLEQDQTVKLPKKISEADLARLPSPWLDGTLGIQGRDGALWELARGCPYGCTYCYESKGNKQVRYLSDERISEELRLFVRGYVPYVFVLDPTFNSNNKRALKLLDLIAAETRKNPGPQTHWHFEARAELLTREQARCFAELGASLQIGLQTAEPKVAALVGRPLNRDIFASRIGLLNEEGAVFGLDLIYGLPGDSLAGYRRSLDFALSLYPNSLDLFRLAVLPGTALFDRATELGLEADEDAPYLVRATPDFPAGDLAKAERLSQAADLFYNEGRAVGWFNQALLPLRMKPSVFLEGFVGRSKTASIEGMQLSYLEERYRRAKKGALLPALRDLVRFHGAWGRALAEGVSTDIAFTYHPDDVLGEDALDLESFASSFAPHPVKARVRPGKDGPELEW